MIDFITHIVSISVVVSCVLICSLICTVAYNNWFNDDEIEETEVDEHGTGKDV